MEYLLAFAIAAVISLWGSLQLGIVNVAVIQTALDRGRTQAYFMAVGGALAEIPYVLIAAVGSRWAHSLQGDQQWIYRILGLVFIGLGLYFLVRPVVDRPIDRSKQLKAHGGSFLKGFGLAILNPQLIIYWSGILFLLESGKLGWNDLQLQLELDLAGRWSFAIGAAAGAFAMLSIYIWLSLKFHERFGHRFRKIVNVLVGIFFLIFGLLTLLSNVF